MYNEPTYGGAPPLSMPRHPGVIPRTVAGIGLGFVPGTSRVVGVMTGGGGGGGILSDPRFRSKAIAKAQKVAATTAATAAAQTAAATATAPPPPPPLVPITTDTATGPTTQAGQQLDAGFPGQIWPEWELPPAGLTAAPGAGGVSVSVAGSEFGAPEGRGFGLMELAVAAGLAFLVSQAMTTKRKR